MQHSSIQVQKDKRLQHRPLQTMLEKSWMERNLGFSDKWVNSFSLTGCVSKKG
jgi:hypothetical protein